ncbi:MAG: leucine-rich repeat protein, partial [Lactobacillus sp.]|nr:leucine-rich repeat protein [Lactobacillus sp.]
MNKHKLTKKRKRQLLTMFALAGVAASNATGPTIALADTINASDQNKTTTVTTNQTLNSSDILKQASIGTSAENTASTEQTTAESTTAESTTGTTQSEDKTDATVATTDTTKAVDVQKTANQPKTTNVTAQAEAGVLTIDHKTSGTLSMEIATVTGAMADPTAVKSIVINGSATLGDADWATLQTLNKRLYNVTGLTLNTPDTTIVPGGLANAAWMTTLTATNVQTIGNDAFAGVNNLQSINLGITDTTQLAKAFKDSADKITSFTLNNVTKTPNLEKGEAIELTEGFASFTSLTDVKMDNIKEIGDNTFSNTNSLTTISCPKIEKIGHWAFFSEKNKGSLKDLTGLDNVTKIGNNVFNGQTSLTKIDLPNVTSLDFRDFAYVPATEVNLPNVTSVTSVGKAAFYKATNITKVNLGITDTTQLAT